MEFVGLLVAVAVAAAGVWAWHRRRCISYCGLLRQALAPIYAATENGAGVYYVGKGAFTAEGEQAIKDTAVFARSINDRVLRELVVDMIDAYEKTRPELMKWATKSPNPALTSLEFEVLRGVAARFEPARTSVRLLNRLRQIDERVGLLERRGFGISS